MSERVGIEDMETAVAKAQKEVAEAQGRRDAKFSDDILKEVERRRIKPAPTEEEMVQYAYEDAQRRSGLRGVKDNLTPPDGMKANTSTGMYESRHGKWVRVGDRLEIP